MDDKRRTAGNDEDIDLSGMINEYSQDNELRKKIEELKKQKEEAQQEMLAQYDPFGNMQGQNGQADQTQQEQDTGGQGGGE